MEPSDSGRASAGSDHCGTEWDTDSGKEMDVNLIHIYKDLFLKCTAPSVLSLSVLPCSIIGAGKRLMFSLTLGPQLAADALPQAQTE